MKRLVISLLLAFLVSASFLGISVVIHAKGDQVQAAQYDDMGDQLLTEFLRFHESFTPQYLFNMCETNPAWQLLGHEPINGFMWVAVAVPDGILSFGYVQNSLQPQIVAFIPKSQAFVGKTVNEAVAGLVKECTIQFKRAPDMIVKNMIVYKLTKDISVVIFVGPDGSHSVSTGISKFIKLPDVEDA